MKNLYWFLLVMLFAYSTSALAQDVDTGGKNCVRYVKEHVLYDDNGAVNVLDLDLEWPEITDNTDVKPLQTYLSELLFNAAEADLDSALTMFKGSLGERVTKQFAAIPNDNKFCYVSCTLREIGYMPARFVSFNASYVCSPGIESPQKGDTINKMITYDLINNKVLLMKDIVKTNDIASGNVSESFLSEFFRNASDKDVDGLLSINIQDAALAYNSVLFSGAFITDYDYLPFMSSVARSNMQSLLTRDVKKMLKADIPVRSSYVLRIDSTMNGEPIYSVADSMPVFRESKDSLARYISKNFVYPTNNDEQGYKGRVMVYFVIDKYGYVKNIRVVSAFQPELNREVARVFEMMPRWNPGIINDKPVNVRISMPLTFVAQ